MENANTVLLVFLAVLLAWLVAAGLVVWRREKKARQRRPTVLPLVYGPFEDARTLDTVLGPYGEDILIDPPIELAAGERILINMTHTPRFGVYEAGKRIAVYQLSDDRKAYHKQ